MFRSLLFRSPLPLRRFLPLRSRSPDFRPAPLTCSARNLHLLSLLLINHLLVFHIILRYFLVNNLTWSISQRQSERAMRQIVLCFSDTLRVESVSLAWGFVLQDRTCDRFANDILPHTPTQQFKLRRAPASSHGISHNIYLFVCVDHNFVQPARQCYGHTWDL